MFTCNESLLKNKKYFQNLDSYFTMTFDIGSLWKTLNKRDFPKTTHCDGAYREGCRHQEKKFEIKRKFQASYLLDYSTYFE